MCGGIPGERWIIRLINKKLLVHQVGQKIMLKHFKELQNNNV